MGQICVIASLLLSVASRLLTNYLGHSPLHESRVAVAIIGCPAGWSKWPSSEAAASEGANRTSAPYVEPLSETRTKPADFFNILLVLALE